MSEQEGGSHISERMAGDFAALFNDVIAARARAVGTPEKVLAERAVPGVPTLEYAREPAVGSSAIDGAKSAGSQASGFPCRTGVKQRVAGSDGGPTWA